MEKYKILLISIETLLLITLLLENKESYYTRLIIKDLYNIVILLTIMLFEIIPKMKYVITKQITIIDLIKYIINRVKENISLYEKVDEILILIILMLPLEINIIKIIISIIITIIIKNIKDRTRSIMVNYLNNFIIYYLISLSYIGSSNKIILLITSLITNVDIIILYYSVYSLVI